jgi:hypothetical protein
MLIKQMSAKNRLWGAERIRGELLKLDIRRSQTDDPEVYAVGSSNLRALYQLAQRWFEKESY